MISSTVMYFTIHALVGIARPTALKWRSRMKVHYVRNDKISVMVVIAAVEIRIFVSELSSICTTVHKRYRRLNQGSMFKQMET